MHILLIPSWYTSKEQPIGGTYFREQAQALHREGHKVGVIFLEACSLRSPGKSFKVWSRGFEYENDCGVLTYRLPYWYWLSRVPFGHVQSFINLGKKLYSYYVAEQGIPDVLHAHSALMGGVLAVELKKTFGIPVVITEHNSSFARGLLPSSQQNIAAETFGNANQRIVVSPLLGKLLQSQYPDNFATWHWIPNLVDPLFTNLDSLNLIRANRPFRFLNIAHLREVKNHKDLILAFASRFKGITNVELRIGGNGPNRSELEKMTSELGIKGQVKFLGELSREKVCEEMQQADVFVLSSKYETFGVVLIEALACGTPVIATSCGGPECIVNEKNGLLVPIQNVEELSIAMQIMHKNIEFYNPTIISQDCLDRFGSHSISQQLTKIYSELVAN